MSHLRLDPLGQEWITIAAKRLSRPITTSAAACPFCPVGSGAIAAECEASEAPSADYDVAVFANRFPSLGGVPAEGDLAPVAPGHRTAPAGGRAEIVLYSPRHGVHLADLETAQIRLLVDVWAERTLALLALDDVEYVFVFENRGRDVGQTIDHPHGQIYAYPFLPARPGRELEVARAFRAAEGECLQCAVLARELADGRRLVDREGGWTAFVPFAPRFPSELHLVPSRHAGSLPDLLATERSALAVLLQRTVRRYDGLYGSPMQYMMVVLQAPRRTTPHDLWHLRLAFYPILRAAGRLKYLAGSESGAGAFLQDARPEDAARALRAVSLS